MKPLIIISAALKSAITPFLRGLMVLIPGLVCSSLMMMVLAVPRSIAIS